MTASARHLAEHPGRGGAGDRGARRRRACAGRRLSRLSGAGCYPDTQGGIDGKNRFATKIIVDTGRQHASSRTSESSRHRVHCIDLLSRDHWAAYSCPVLARLTKARPARAVMRDRDRLSRSGSRTRATGTAVTVTVTVTVT